MACKSTSISCTRYLHPLTILNDSVFKNSTLLLSALLPAYPIAVLSFTHNNVLKNVDE